MPSLKIAVVSDIHACDSEESAKSVSFLNISAPEDQLNYHPISGLIEYIKNRSLKADVLVCAGDMADKASPAAIKYAWGKLHNIKDALEAKLLVPATGNHDLDSRHVNDYDAKGLLQGLVPGFPVSDDNDRNKYWAQNYVFYEIDSDVRILLLNSAAFHGEEPKEITHGRISQRTLESIRQELDSKETKTVNILICHHHLIKYGEIDPSDYSVMKGGEQLLELIGEGKYGEWMVVHGHKHHPKITYSTGSNTAPIILSSGSLCSILYPQLGSHVRNQFHIIDIPASDLEALGFGLVGRVRSWNWCYGTGWQTATKDSGLPASCGFGYRGSISPLAKRVSALIKKQRKEVVNWKDIEKSEPCLSYLLPSDLNTLVNMLRGVGHNITWNEFGDTIAMIGKVK